MPVRFISSEQALKRARRFNIRPGLPVLRSQHDRRHAPSTSWLSPRNNPPLLIEVGEPVEIVNRGCVGDAVGIAVSLPGVGAEKPHLGLGKRFC